MMELFPKITAAGFSGYVETQREFPQQNPQILLLSLFVFTPRGITL
jgi:hypothetical protein